MRNPELTEATRILVKALAALRVATVELPYDGGDDSGQIEGVFATDAAHQPVALHGPITVAL